MRAKCNSAESGHGLVKSALLLILIFTPPLAAQKTDVVILRNGDHFTGEVKKLEHGKLQLKTDDAGTIYIKWNKIARLTAKAFFEVEVEDGTVYFGSLAENPLVSRINIVSDTATVELYKFAVVSIIPIKGRFWARVNGSVNVGFSYTKASDVGQFNLSGDASQRGRSALVNASLSSVITAQKGEATTKRNNLTVQYVRFLRHRWYVGGTSSSEQNSELGIDLRLSTGAFAARSLVQTNENWFYYLAGLQGTHESVSGAVSGKFNLEAPVGLAFSKFRYDAPEIDLNSKATVYVNLTTRKRYRFEFDNNLTWKFIKDVTLKLTLYASYDTKPPSVDAAKSDFGTTVSLGWTFNR